MPVKIASGINAVSYGDISRLIDGATAFTVAITLTPTAATVTNNRIVSKWGSGAATFLLQVTDTDELAFVCDNGATGRSSRKTSALNMVAGRTYRIVCRFDPTLASGFDVDIWVNGERPTDAAWLGAYVCASLGASAHSVNVGVDNTGGATCVTGFYSHFAMWGAKISESACAQYGRGVLPPDIRAPRRLLYDPMDGAARGGLKNQWGPENGSLVGTGVTGAYRAALGQKALAPRAPALAAAGGFNMALFSRARALGGRVR